ncbi:unnamed protein product, partial [marine sediment metagenome]
LRFRDNTGAKDVGEGAAPGAHDLAGAQHNPSTLANLNAKVSDADLANEAEVIKKDGSVAFTSDQAMGGNRLTDLPTPIAGNEPATKDHVDSVIQGLDWQPSVLDELADPPGTPAAGDRYLVIATATGDWAEHEDDIAEWNGTTWDFTTPNKGYAVWLEDVGRQKNYNGTTWVYFGSTVSHDSLTEVTATSHHNNVNDPAAGEKAALPG